MVRLIEPPQIRSIPLKKLNIKSLASKCDCLPWLSVAVMLAVAVVVLRWQGRLWSCECGEPWRLWISDPRSSHTSQHLFDPYAFTHVLHGVLLAWLLDWLAPRMRRSWQMTSALAVEIAWEVLENSEFVVRRYREHTAALGYFGDSIVNVIGDILACAAGVAIAWKLGFRWSLALLIATEIILILTIRDSLLINVITLFVPSDAITNWQLGR